MFSSTQIKITRQPSPSTSPDAASGASSPMTLPVLAKKMKKLASVQFFNLKLLLNGESSRGFSKFKKNYKLKAELGRGGFGVVYRAVRTCDDTLVAVKFIERNNVKEWARINGEQVPMEICMLAKCSKVRGVIRLLDWYSIPEGFLIVMERPYPCIDMFDFIKGQGKISEEMARFLFRQIAVTVHECVQNRVLHRDLKDENVVIDLATGTTKLIDFGAATVLRRSQYADFQGTRLYCPPEWFLHSLYLGREAAVWSLGVLLYNSLNGRLPFRNEKDICTAHLLGPLPFFVPVSAEVKDLISRCLAFDPFQRCSLESILNHPWIKQKSPTWEILTKTRVQKKTSVDVESSESSDHHIETQQPGSADEGVGSSAASSSNVKEPKEHRMAKTSLLAPPTSVEMKAAVQASKTPTQFNVHSVLKNQRQIKNPRHHHQPAHSTVLTALRRAMSREAQKRISGVSVQD